MKWSRQQAESSLAYNFLEVAMKRNSIAVLSLCACFVTAAWCQQPGCAHSPLWAEFHKENMQRWNPCESEKPATTEYDAANRKLHPRQSRRIQSEPSGSSAANSAHSQTWNRYGYAPNNPLSFTAFTGKYVCSDGTNCDSEQDKVFEAARQRDISSKDPAVVAAAKAYGDPAKDNGVSVGFANSLPKTCGAGAAGS